MTFENGTFYRIERPRMCPQSEISNHNHWNYIRMVLFPNVLICVELNLMIVWIFCHIPYICMALQTNEQIVCVVRDIPSVWNFLNNYFFDTGIVGYLNEHNVCVDWELNVHLWLHCIDCKRIVFYEDDLKYVDSKNFHIHYWIGNFIINWFDFQFIQR